VRHASAELDVSETVREAIRARVERLRPETQAVLQEASVLGQVFGAEPLQRMGAHGETAVEDALEEALLAALVEETTRRDGHAAAYSFRHALMQRAVYLAIPSPRRRRLHRAAAEALEVGPGGTRLRQAATLAWHFLEGDAVARALPYTLEAGDQAEAVYAHAEAERQYRLASELAHDLAGQARDDRELRQMREWEAEALEKLSRLFDLDARREEAVSCAAHAVEVRRALEEPDGLAWATSILARALNRSGRLAEGTTLLWRLLVELAGAQGATALDEPPDLAGVVAERALRRLSPRIAARLSISLCVYSTCPPISRLLDALRPNDWAIALAHTAGDGKLEAEAHAIRGATLAGLGRNREATAAHERAMALAEAAGAYDPLVVSSLNLATALCDRGDLAGAALVVQRHLRTAEQLGDAEYLGMLWYTAADAAFIAGDWGRARANLANISAQLPVNQRDSALGVARLELLEGRPGWAIPALETELAAYVEGEDPQRLLCAGELLAEGALLEGRADAALAYLSRLPQNAEQAYSGAMAVHAWVLAECGDEQAATRVLTAVLEWARREEQRVLYVNALRIRAHLALRACAWDEAEEALERALEIARAIPYPYAEAKALYTHGQLDVARGEHAHARAHFQAALAILGHLGERPYAELVERGLAALPGVDPAGR
jgi:tetratricopeptide (TPR) repeat protein